MEYKPLISIIGLRVETIKGYRTDEIDVDVRYILFNDKKTIIELDDLYPHYNYNNVDTIVVYEDQNLWKEIYGNETNFPKSSFGGEYNGKYN